MSPENSKNCQNHDLFEVAVMGRRILPPWENFFPNDRFNVKSPQLSKIKAVEPITPGVSLAR